MNPLLFLLSAAAALIVLASPHGNHLPRHHALAVRATNRRCRNRSSSSPSPSPTPTVGPSPLRLNPSPTTSSTPYVNPVPTTTTPSPQPTTTTPSSNSNLPSFMYGTQSGDGTFFDVGLGACGVTNQATDYIVAVSRVLFDEYPGYDRVNPNTNPVCGKKVKVNYQGKSIICAVQDRCDACAVGSLDFSTSAFSQLANLALGRVEISWTWV